LAATKPAAQTDLTVTSLKQNQTQETDLFSSFQPKPATAQAQISGMAQKEELLGRSVLLHLSR
jgi:hypothetical protein